MQIKPALLISKLALASVRFCQKAYSFSAPIGRASKSRSEESSAAFEHTHSLKQQGSNEPSHSLLSHEHHGAPYHWPKPRDKSWPSFDAPYNAVTRNGTQGSARESTTPCSAEANATPFTSLSTFMANSLQNKETADQPHLYSDVTIYDHDVYAHKSSWSLSAALAMSAAFIISFATAHAAPNDGANGAAGSAAGASAAAGAAAPGAAGNGGAGGEQYMIGSSATLKYGPNLEVERKLLLTHEEMVKKYADNYVSMMQKKQPANKTEGCMITADALDRILKPNSMVFWEGKCKDGRADGFGRAYVVTSGRIVFEMLTNLHSEDPLYNTIYYIKNTELETSTQYFFGRSVRIQSSGLIITHTKLNDDITVGMQMSDKANLITYQKDTSLREPYILNIKDYGNYAHFLHDLSETPYPTLTMSYRLLDRQSGYNVGYQFTGRKNGLISGKISDDQGHEKPAKIPEDVIARAQEVADEVDINVQDTLTDVIDSLRVFNAYKEAVCDPGFNNNLCNKMKCKDICDLKNNITPDDSRVKDMLVRLVKHHNSRPLYTYLSTAKNAEDEQAVAAFTPKPGVVDKDNSIVAQSISGYHSSATSQHSGKDAGDKGLDLRPKPKSDDFLHKNLYPGQMTQEQIDAKSRDAQAVAEVYRAAAEKAENTHITERLDDLFGPGPDPVAAPAQDGKPGKIGNNEFGYGDKDTYRPQPRPSANTQGRVQEEPLYQAQGPSLAPRSYSAPDPNSKERQMLREAQQTIKPELNKHDERFKKQQQEMIEQQRREHQLEIEEAKARALQQLQRDRERREEILETSRPRLHEERGNQAVDLSDD